MDVDEFFVMHPEHNATVFDYADKMLSADGQLDVIAFPPTVISYCNNTKVHGNETLLESINCITTSHLSGPKLIMKSNRIWSYMVHYAWYTKNWTKT